MKPIYSLLLLGLGSLVLSCGASMADSEYAEYDSNGWIGVDTVAPEDDAAAADVLPPEEEVDLDLKTPQASLHYVYVAATARDSVVRIDAESLDIQIIEVGGRPTTVATLPDADAAIVINSGTRDISIIHSTPDENAVTTLDILPYTNTIDISPDGRFALIYYTEKMAESGDPVGDFQTVAVVALEQGKEKVYRISTGFNITDVFFHSSQDLAYLVTNDGVGVLDLANLKDGSITPQVSISDDPSEDPEQREVLITPDGAYAVVRYAADPHLRVVELETGDMTLFELDTGATDLDLVPGSNQVLVVLREAQKAELISLPKLFDQPEEAAVEVDITGFMAGTAQVSPNGNYAVLYTTVKADKPENTVRSVGLLTLSTTPPSYKILPVQKPILAVAISPRSGSALLMHETEVLMSNGSDVEDAVSKSNGVTVMDLNSGYRKFIQTGFKWSQHLFVSSDTEDQQVFILTPDPNDVDHQMVALSMTTYLKQVIHLISKPSSMVYVPLSNKVAVSQEHPSGRISFVDGEDGSVYSVTGYEIAGFIH